MKVIRDDEPYAPITPPKPIEEAAPTATAAQYDAFPYDAPWWLRYPLGVAALGGAWYCAFEWQTTRWAHWLLAGMFAFMALGLLRELFLGIMVAALVGLALWAFGAAFAALPVSVAIIIGAMIIASRMR
ncbi:hypothetical protein ACGLHS_28950 [Variovorax sp. VaC1]|uniref:hypothetical protein n=1 Tax=Variovorax sp. VaC1 TaxID=3373132 RepID=UPI0037479891